jgi:DNA anti-recombination protein RmuC
MSLSFVLCVFNDFRWKIGGKLPNTVGKLSNTVGKLSNTVGKLSNTVRKLSNTGA